MLKENVNKKWNETIKEVNGCYRSDTMVFVDPTADDIYKEKFSPLDMGKVRVTCYANTKETYNAIMDYPEKDYQWYPSLLVKLMRVIECTAINEGDYIVISLPTAYHYCEYANYLNEMIKKLIQTKSNPVIKNFTIYGNSQSEQSMFEVMNDIGNTNSNIIVVPDFIQGDVKNILGLTCANSVDRNILYIDVEYPNKFVVYGGNYDSFVEYIKEVKDNIKEAHNYKKIPTYKTTGSNNEIALVIDSIYKIAEDNNLIIEPIQNSLKEDILNNNIARNVYTSEDYSVKIQEGSIEVGTLDLRFSRPLLTSEMFPKGLTLEIAFNFDYDLKPLPESESISIEAPEYFHDPGLTVLEKIENILSEVNMTNTNVSFIGGELRFPKGSESKSTNLLVRNNKNKPTSNDLGIIKCKLVNRRDKVIAIVKLLEYMIFTKNDNVVITLENNAFYENDSILLEDHINKSPKLNFNVVRYDHVTKISNEPTLMISPLQELGQSLNYLLSKNKNVIIVECSGSDIRVMNHDILNLDNIVQCIEILPPIAKAYSFIGNKSNIIRILDALRTRLDNLYDDKLLTNIMIDTTEWIAEKMKDLIEENIPQAEEYFNAGGPRIKIPILNADGRARCSINIDLFKEGTDDYKLEVQYIPNSVKVTMDTLAGEPIKPAKELKTREELNSKEHLKELRADLISEYMNLTELDRTKYEEREKLIHMITMLGEQIK